MRYREGFKEVLDATVVDAIRSSVQTGTPLGNHQFKYEIERLLGVRVGQARRGRPPKRMNDKMVTPFRSGLMLHL